MRFEVRLAEHAPAAGLTAAVATDSGRTVYLHSDVVVSNGDIASARLEPGDGDGQFGVDIALTATGAEQIRAASAGHVGRPMAVLIDGQVVAAPVVRSPIGEAAIITGAYSREQAERIVSGIVGE
ncbi:MAG: hypothetical protein FJW23_09990 [Acidimicrobiia bacterium]|nr:hypothetical protein [Acidimicrobiia bacterium]